MDAVTLMVVAFVVLVILNVPVAFAMGSATALALYLSGGLPLQMVPQKMASGIESFPFLAIPLFILTGGLMETGGISRRLVEFAQSLVGHIRGGLGLVMVVAEMFFSGISGAALADASAIGTLLIPSMIRAKYKPSQAAALMGAAAGMGMLIPPCLLMVILGAIGGISIAGLFLAGFLPAFLMALTLAILIYFQARRGTIPDATEKKATFREILSSFILALLPLGLPLIIFGGILGGIFTATEAAVIAAVYSFIVGVFIYKEITLRQTFEILVTTTKLTGVVCLLIGFATGFSWVLATHQLPQVLGAWITSVSPNKYVFLLFTILIFLFFSAVLDGLPAMLIFFPILYPTAVALGIDPLHFGIVIIGTMGIGLILPPIGIVLVIICSITKIKLGDTIRPMLPYLTVLVCDLVIIAFWPQLVLIFPKLVGLH
ncbi:MAG: dicarboxylate transporter subunit DctM [Deltaproteobacteria bacterium]|nr:dicarboxylate transporter subunit DctM [Deltaproteobacteria bacterium]